MTLTVIPMTILTVQEGESLSFQLEDPSLGRLTSVNDYDARGLKVTCASKEIATRVLEIMAPTENWQGVLLTQDDPENFLQLNIAPECPAEYLVDR